MSTTGHTVTREVALFKALSNPKRITILCYLHHCKFATNRVVVKNTSIPQPQVSAGLKILLAAEIIIKEKIGTQQIYALNEPVWQTIRHLVI